jgi:hypothetical protein
LGTDAWQLTHYALSVGITLAVTYATGAVVLRLSPGFFDFMTGGRAEQNRSDRAVPDAGVDEARTTKTRPPTRYQALARSSHSPE